MCNQGVSYFNRKLIANVSCQVILTNFGKRWESKTLTSLKNTHKIYNDGDQFEETTLDGRLSKSCVKSDGPHKLIHEQRNPDNNELVTKITREIIEDKLVQVISNRAIFLTQLFSNKNTTKK